MKPTIKTAFAAFVTAAAVSAVVLGTAPAQAAGNVATPAVQDWSFKGLFGTFDRASAQRGYKVYKEVCSACHSLNLIKFRNLQDLGFSEAQVKALAAEYEIQDGPNDDGEMFTRKRTPSDPLPAPFANEKAAAAANNGKAPPDLSLITKARAQGGDSVIKVSLKHPGGFTLGADYVYALLTGYGEPPAGVEVPDGGNYNKYFPGGVIAMASPLAADAVEFSDGTKATVAQMAHDVTMFLSWAAEPELEARKRLGVKVMLFLLVLTGMLFALKRKIWSDIH
ncbi:MAG: cytochrome c1 [Rhodospirillales bacterium CG15_BIG_FIL_POST_REV_8_21_14_020_66_15]|nr:MAG: cytochrome c1 [Rhodospirillales bacterium CG15_BIG_FIL_POST_REV_8_21_14_020_66_15]